MTIPQVQMSQADLRGWLMVAIQLGRMQNDVKAQGLHQVGIGANLHTLKPRSTLNYK